MSATKIEVSSSNFEVDQESRPKRRMVSMIEGARLALTAVVLASAITILVVSTDSFAVYKRTSLPSDFLLPLWPEDFDLRPMTAMIATSALITVFTAIALVASMVPSLRKNSLITLVTGIVIPVIGFILAFIAMAFFYGVNASDTDETFQSWTCRWSDVAMRSEPHFGTLCKQSHAGLGLSVAIVPLEAVVFGLAAYQMVLQRKGEMPRSQKSASPALS
jgi:hypothetical protein